MRLTREFLLITALAAQSARGFSPLARGTRSVYVMRPSTRDGSPTHATRTKSTMGFMKQLFSFLETGKGAERVNKEEMQSLLADLDTNGRGKTRTVALDVRSPAEVSQTGPLSPSVITFPLNLIQEGAFAMPEKEFQKKYGIAKPLPDERLVFSCKSGMRAGMAADIAAKAGYKNVVVYPGGSAEWF